MVNLIPTQDQWYPDSLKHLAQKWSVPFEDEKRLRDFERNDRRRRKGKHVTKKGEGRQAKRKTL